LQNELILEFPTKSTPSGFRAAAIMDHWTLFQLGYTLSASLSFPDLIRGLTGQCSIGSWWFLDGLGIRFNGRPPWSD